MMKTAELLEKKSDSVNVDWKTVNISTKPLVFFNGQFLYNKERDKFSAIDVIKDQNNVIFVFSSSCISKAYERTMRKFSKFYKHVKKYKRGVEAIFVSCDVQEDVMWKTYDTYHRAYWLVHIKDDFTTYLLYQYFKTDLPYMAVVSISDGRVVSSNPIQDIRQWGINASRMWETTVHCTSEWSSYVEKIMERVKEDKKTEPIERIPKYDPNE